MELRITSLLASGDYREALALLARAYGQPVGRYCAVFVGSASEGEELLQETLIQAYRAMPQYGGQSNPKSWLFGIARRICIRHIRQRARRRGIMARWLWSQPEPPPAVDSAEQSEEAAALRSALAALEPRLRDAVLLRYQGELDHQEIAAVLGVSHAAARKRVSLGLKSLRSTLAPMLMQAEGSGGAAGAAAACAVRSGPRPVAAPALDRRDVPARVDAHARSTAEDGTTGAHPERGVSTPLRDGAVSAKARVEEARGEEARGEAARVEAALVGMMGGRA